MACRPERVRLMDEVGFYVTISVTIVNRSVTIISPSPPPGPRLRAPGWEGKKT
jgi:hypothetical protein